MTRRRTSPLAHALVPLAIRIGTLPASAQCEEGKLLASDRAVDDSLGVALDVGGDRVAVGALTWLGFLDAAGWACVFERSGTTWSEGALLVPGDPKDDDYFGGSVALAGEELFVGAPYADFDYGVTYRFTDGGGAWLYENDAGTWKKRAVLVAPDAEPDDGFGDAVAVGGGRIVVATPDEDGERVIVGLQVSA